MSRENPLTRTDFSAINASLAKLNQVLPELEFLKSLGYDVGEFEARHQKMISDLEAFKKMYFPNQS